MATKTTQRKCELCGGFIGKAVVCTKCHYPQPFERVFDSPQHTDVSLSMQLNLIDAGDLVKLRMPLYQFNTEGEVDGKDPAIESIALWLTAHGVNFKYVQSNPVNFLIARNEQQKVTTWVDANSHGIRIRTSLGECEISYDLLRNALIKSTTCQQRKAIAVNGMVVEYLD